MPWLEPAGAPTVLSRSRGTIDLPTDIRVLEVGSDCVLGTYEADSGEPHVAMYEMSRVSIPEAN